MKKTIKSLKNEGIIITIKKIFRFIKYKFTISINSFNKNLIKKEIDINNFKTIIVFENNFGWNKIMKQRPQQIAENLPEDTLMFYHSHENEDYLSNKRIRKVKENLILIDLGYYRDLLLGELSFHNNKFLMIYSTDYISLKRIKMYGKYNYKIIYEYVDDINIDLSGKEIYEKLTDRHQEILKMDNVYVSCTADKLYNNIIVNNQNKNKVKLITNGVDYSFFEYREYPLPKDMIPIKKKYKHLVGYYGALANWFDYKLIKKIAENKSYAIVMLGVDYDASFEKSGISKLDNVFYLGKKDYNILPTYGCNFDVCIIPFLINEITLSTSPVKVFEYMAMQKPIVTTALPECMKYESVLSSKDHSDFIRNVDTAITKLINNENYKSVLKREAKENDWKIKASNLIEMVNSEVNDVQTNN